MTSEAGQSTMSISESTKRSWRYSQFSLRRCPSFGFKETDELKRKMRIYHQRMMLMVEAQLEDIKSHEWEEILKPTATYIGDGEEIERNY